MHYHIKTKMRHLDNHNFLFPFFFLTPHLSPSNKEICMSHTYSKIVCKGRAGYKENHWQNGGKGLYTHRCNQFCGQPNAYYNLLSKKRKEK